MLNKFIAAAESALFRSKARKRGASAASSALNTKPKKMQRSRPSCNNDLVGRFNPLEKRV